MKIHGVRIYPKSVKTVPGRGAPMFVHGSLAEDRSDFDYIFRPLAGCWRNHFFVRDFAVSYANGGITDPIPGLRNSHGPDFYDADLKTQLLMICAEGFATWAPTFHSCEGAFLPLFREAPSFELLGRLFWDRDFVLSSDTWPSGMRSLLHNWDDMFWQLFSIENADIDLLIRSHSTDSKLKMFVVDLDREFPEPSNEDLAPAT